MKFLKNELTGSKSIYIQECRKFMENLERFCKEWCGLDTSGTFNRVDLKKSILTSTMGKSLTKFVQTLSINDKKNLINLCSMECPVVCPTKKMILQPIESMPSRVMKSCKKLRNFFGIPELQVCRGCVKRSRCRRFQQVERDVPDLSDLASVMVGMHSICKLHLDGNELIIPEFAFTHLSSISSVLYSLSNYFRQFNLQTEIPRGDEKACERELRRRRREQEFKKLEMMKEKVFNIPKGFNIIPKSSTYMASFQRGLYQKLFKKKRMEQEFVWVPDTSDDSIPNENSKLEKINQSKIELTNTESQSDTESYSILKDRIEELSVKDVKFRMEYFNNLGSENELQRYDVMNDRMIEGLKITDRRFRVDLDKNLRTANSTDLKVENGGISMYKIPSDKKMNSLSNFIAKLDTCPNDLSFLKRVPFNYKCQSSGEDLVSKSLHEDLSEVALAINSAK